MSDSVYRHSYRRPPQRIRWIPPTDQATTTLTPATATLTLTSFAPLAIISAGEFYRTLTIDPLLVLNTDQTNFPVLVSLTHVDLKSVSNGGHVASENGFDILFFSDVAFTSQLSHEIERYDPTTGELVTWVKLPTVFHAIATTFYLKYGDPSITSSQEDAPDVWSNGFTGVWHLGNGTILDAKNSVTGGASIVSGPTAVGGQIDGGTQFAGIGSTSHITTDLAGLQTTNATYEIWSKRDGDGDSGFGRMWVKGSSANSQLQFYNDATTYSPDEVYIFSAQWDGPSVVGNWSISRPSSGAWHSLAVTYNNSSDTNDPLIYLDGSAATVTERITPSGSLSDDAIEAFGIGQRVVTLNRKWNGQLDEFRVSNVIRSPDWLVTCFNNHDDPQAFVEDEGELAVGDVEVTPATVALVTARFASTLAVVIIPANATLSLTTFAPILTQQVIPATTNLLLAGFAPVIDVSDYITVTPDLTSLTLVSFSPSLKVDVIPGSQSLVLTTFVALLAENVTTTLASLTLTVFAPDIVASVTVESGTASLTIGTFTPSLRESVVPGSASLSLNTFAPTISVNVMVEPPAATLTISTFSPSLKTSLTPEAGSLFIATFTPFLNLSLQTANLTLSTFAPLIAVGDSVIVEPPIATLTITAFAPSIVAPVTVILDAAILALGTFGPSLHLVATPQTGALSIALFAPTLSETATPGAASLSVTTTAPLLALSIQPSASTLALTTFAPNVTSGIVADVIVIPATATLVLTTATPHIRRGPTPPRRTFVVESARRITIVPRSSRVYLVPESDREETVA